MEETKQTLSIRAEEHITAVKSASKKGHTADYCWKYNHHFDWEHKEVLDFENNWKARTIKEAICSEENDHYINIWKLILRERKTKKTTAKRSTAKTTILSN